MRLGTLVTTSQGDYLLGRVLLQLIKLSLRYDHLAVIILHLEVVCTLLLSMMMLMVGHDKFSLTIKLLEDLLLAGKGELTDGDSAAASTLHSDRA